MRGSILFLALMLAASVATTAAAQQPAPPAAAQHAIPAPQQELPKVTAPLLLRGLTRTDIEVLDLSERSLVDASQQMPGNEIQALEALIDTHPQSKQKQEMLEAALRQRQLIEKNQVVVGVFSGRIYIATTAPLPSPRPAAARTPQTPATGQPPGVPAAPGTGPFIPPVVPVQPVVPVVPGQPVVPATPATPAGPRGTPAPRVPPATPPVQPAPQPPAQPQPPGGR